MALIIPLQAVPNQTLSTIIGNQNCRINVYQLFFGLYLDLIVNGVPVRAGVSCLNRNRLIRYKYLPFIGDLVFFDTQGSLDPVYTGLGGRFQLAYLEAADLAAAGS